MRLGKREIEWILPLLTACLIGMGLLVLYSASSTLDVDYFNRQLLFLGIGIPIFVAAAFLSHRYIFAFSYLFYIAVLLMLALVLLVGSGPTGRWLSIKMLNLHVQPSELAKLATILALSRFLSDHRNDLTQLKNLLYLALIAGLPFLLIAVEPDLGTSFVIAVIAGVIAYWGGIPRLAIGLIISPFAVMLASLNPFTLIMVIGGLILFAYISGVGLPLGLIWGSAVGIIGAFTPMLMQQLKPYQRQRLAAFIRPEDDPLGSGYQLIQSKVAIGSGHFWGKGFLQGTQAQGGFLPAQHNDFIFSVFGEEFGFFGAIIILLLFWLLIVRLLVLARKVANPFSSLFLVGIAGVISFQMIVNIGMTIGMMPVTGLPLPLISYGGSSLLTTLLGLGIATGFASRWRQWG